MTTQGWIRCSDRLPTKEDASEECLVPCWHPTWTKVRTADVTQPMNSGLYWHPWPKPPEPELRKDCPECGSSMRFSDCLTIQCNSTDCQFAITANTRTRAVELCNALPRGKTP